MIGDPDALPGRRGWKAPTHTGPRSPGGSSRPGTTYTRYSGPNARCDAGTASPIPSTPSPRPAACSPATGPACEKRGWVGRGATRPDAERAQAGHGDDRAVQLRDGTADHRPGTHPGTLPRAAHPDQDAQARACRPSGNMVEQGMLVALKAAGKAWKALKEQADLLERSMRLILRSTPARLLDIYCASTVTAATLAIVAGTIPNASAARPRLPNSAAPAPSLPPAARPTGTGSTKAATGRATPPCTTSPSSACATTSPPATT